MKKAILCALPIACLSIFAFAAPATFGVHKLSDSPLYQVDHDNGILPHDREFISNYLQEFYQIPEAPHEMEFLMVQGAKARILFKRKSVKSIDVEEMLVAEEGKSEAEAIQLRPITDLLARYE